MINLVFKRLLFWVTVLLLVTPLYAWSAPRQATIYHGFAFVTEQIRVKTQPASSGLKKATFLISGKADPSSIVIVLEGDTKQTINNISHRQVIRKEEKRLLELRREIKKLKDTRNSLQATLHALDNQIQFWEQQTKSKTRKASDALEFSATISRNTKKAWQEKLSLQPQMEIYEQKIKAVQKDIDKFSDSKLGEWEVVVLLSGPKEKEITMSCSYNITGCGWQPSYRLSAIPKDNKIVFIREAEVWQDSGQDWHDVDIHLATQKNGGTSLAGTDSEKRTGSDPEMRTRTKSKKARRKSTEQKQVMSGNPSPSRKAEEKYSYSSVLPLGKRYLNSGVKSVLKIDDETWPASFVYFSHPAQGTEVLLKAIVNIQNYVTISQGNAIFMLDGAMLGKKLFSFSGNENSVVFGVDPLVTANRTLLPETKGGAGITQDNRKLTETRRIGIENKRKHTIRMHVEEPLTKNSYVEGTKITITYQPEISSQTKDASIWEFDVGPGEKKTININMMPQ